MPDVDSAIKLAQLMVKLGQSCGRRVTAVLSAMSAPLGAAVGNALEVAEAAEILRQAECAPVSADLRRLCLVLAGTPSFHSSSSNSCMKAATRGRSEPK